MTGAPSRYDNKRCGSLWIHSMGQPGPEIRASIRLLAECRPEDVPERIITMKRRGVDPRTVAGILDRGEHPVPMPTWVAFLSALNTEKPAALPTAPKPVTARLTDEQRAALRQAFEAVPDAQVYGWAYVYMSRELRFRSRFRDWLGISQILEWAMARGVLEKVECAIERVEQEIRGHYPAIEEVYVIPEWERQTKQRRGVRKWENKHEPDRFPAAWWAK